MSIAMFLSAPPGVFFPLAGYCPRLDDSGLLLLNWPGITTVRKGRKHTKQAKRRALGRKSRAVAPSMVIRASRKPIGQVTSVTSDADSCSATVRLFK